MIRAILRTYTIFLVKFFTKLWNTSKYGKKLETLLYLLLAVALQLKSTRYVRLKKGLNRESSILLSNEMHLANGICAEPQGPPSSLYDVGKGYRMGNFIYLLKIVIVFGFGFQRAKTFNCVCSFYSFKFCPR